MKSGIYLFIFFLIYFLCHQPVSYGIHGPTTEFCTQVDWVSFKNDIFFRVFPYQTRIDCLVCLGVTEFSVFIFIRVDPSKEVSYTEYALLVES